VLEGDIVNKEKDKARVSRMFDAGYSELVMVGLVALLVTGPERLPKTARLAGFWLGKWAWFNPG
jgi:hypothetical protein